MSTDETAYALTSRLGWVFAISSALLLVYGVVTSHLAVAERTQSVATTQLSPRAQSTAFGF